MPPPPQISPAPAIVRDSLSPAPVHSGLSHLRKSCLRKSSSSSTASINLRKSRCWSGRPTKVAPPPYARGTSCLQTAPSPRKCCRRTPPACPPPPRRDTASRSHGSQQEEGRQVTVAARSSAAALAILGLAPSLACNSCRTSRSEVDRQHTFLGGAGGQPRSTGAPWLLSWTRAFERGCVHRDVATPIIRPFPRRHTPSSLEIHRDRRCLPCAPAHPRKVRGPHPLFL